MADRYEVVITPRAENSLKRILHNLMDKSSFKTAKKIKNDILETIDKLEKYPDSNGIVQEISTEKITFRRILKGSYRIIFVIEESEKLVFVMEINHVRENPEKLKKLLK